MELILDDHRTEKEEFEKIRKGKTKIVRILRKGGNKKMSIN